MNTMDIGKKNEEVNNEMDVEEGTVTSPLKDDLTSQDDITVDGLIDNKVTGNFDVENKLNEIGNVSIPREQIEVTDKDDVENNASEKYVIDNIDTGEAVVIPQKLSTNNRNDEFNTKTEGNFVDKGSQEGCQTDDAKRIGDSIGNLAPLVRDETMFKLGCKEQGDEDYCSKERGDEDYCSKEHGDRDYCSKEQGDEDYCSKEQVKEEHNCKEHCRVKGDNKELSGVSQCKKDEDKKEICRDGKTSEEKGNKEQGKCITFCENGEKQVKCSGELIHIEKSPVQTDNSEKPLSEDGNNKTSVCEDDTAESPYIKTDNTETSFSETASTESPFIKTDKTETSFSETASTESPFIKTDNTETSFSETASTESPFIKTDNTETSFRETASTESSFIKTDNTETSFSETASTESPFIKTDNTETSFSETASTESQYIKTDNTETSFSETASTESQYIKTDKTETSFSENASTESQYIKTDKTETSFSENASTESQYIKTDKTETSFSEIASTESPYIKTYNRETSFSETASTENPFSNIDNVYKSTSGTENIENLLVEVLNIESSCSKVDNTEKSSTEVDNTEKSITKVDNLRKLSSEVDEIDNIGNSLIIDDNEDNLFYKDDKRDQSLHGCDSTEKPHYEIDKVGKSNTECDHERTTSGKADDSEKPLSDTEYTNKLHIDINNVEKPPSNDKIPEELMAETTEKLQPLKVNVKSEMHSGGIRGKRNESVTDDAEKPHCEIFKSEKPLFDVVNVDKSVTCGGSTRKPLREGVSRKILPNETNNTEKQISDICKKPRKKVNQNEKPPVEDETTETLRFKMDDNGNTLTKADKIMETSKDVSAADSLHCGFDIMAGPYSVENRSQKPPANYDKSENKINESNNVAMISIERDNKEKPQKKADCIINNNEMADNTENPLRETDKDENTSIEAESADIQVNTIKNMEVPQSEPSDMASSDVKDTGNPLQKLDSVEATFRTLSSTQESSEKVDNAKKLSIEMNKTNELCLVDKALHETYIVESEKETVDFCDRVPKHIDLNKNPRNIDRIDHQTKKCTFVEKSLCDDNVKEKPQIDGNTIEKPQSEVDVSEKPQSEVVDREKPQSEVVDSEKPQSEVDVSEKPQSEVVDSEKPQSHVVDSEKPQSEVVDSEKPQSEVVDSEKPQSEVVDSEKPQSEVVVSGKPQSEVADSEKSQSEVDVSEKPQSEGVDSEKPQSHVVDSEKPQSEVVDSEKPQSEVVDSEKPQSEVVDSEKPQSEVVVSGKPQSEVADSEKSQSEVVDNEKPQREVHVNEKPQSEVVDSEKSQSEVHVNEKLQSEVVDCEKPQSEVVDCEKPQSEVADSEKPQSEVADSEKPQSKVVDSEKPQSEVVDSKKPQSEVDDSEKPQREVHFNEKLQSEVVDCEKPQNEVADSEKPQSEVADSEKPQSEVADSEKPQSKVVDSEKPQSEVVDSKKPQSEVDDSEKPQSEVVDSEKPQSEVVDSENSQSEVVDSEKPQNEVFVSKMSPSNAEFCKIKKNEFENSEACRSEVVHSTELLPCSPDNINNSSKEIDLFQEQDGEFDSNERTSTFVDLMESTSKVDEENSSPIATVENSISVAEIVEISSDVYSVQIPPSNVILKKLSNVDKVENLSNVDMVEILSNVDIVENPSNVDMVKNLSNIDMVENLSRADVMENPPRTDIVDNLSNIGIVQNNRKDAQFMEYPPNDSDSIENPPNKINFVKKVEDEYCFTDHHQSVDNVDNLHKNGVFEKTRNPNVDSAARTLQSESQCKDHSMPGFNNSGNLQEDLNYLLMNKEIAETRKKRKERIIAAGEVKLIEYLDCSIIDEFNDTSAINICDCGNRREGAESMGFLCVNMTSGNDEERKKDDAGRVETVETCVVDATSDGLYDIRSCKSEKIKRQLTDDQMQKSLKEPSDVMTYLEPIAQPSNVQINLLILSLRQKLRRKKHELKMAKSVHEKQISTVLDRLLQLESHIRREQKEIAAILQGKDDIINQLSSAVEELTAQNRFYIETVNENQKKTAEKKLQKSSVQGFSDASIEDSKEKAVLRRDKSKQGENEASQTGKVRFSAMRDLLRRHKSSLELFQHELNVQNTEINRTRFGSEKNLSIDESPEESTVLNRNVKCKRLITTPIVLRYMNDDELTPSPDEAFDEFPRSISRHDSTSSLVSFDEKTARTNSGLFSPFSYGFTELSKSRSVPQALSAVSQISPDSTVAKPRPQSFSKVEILAKGISAKSWDISVDSASVSSSSVGNASPSPSPTSPSMHSDSNPFRSFKNVFKRRGSKKKRRATLTGGKGSPEESI